MRHSDPVRSDDADDVARAGAHGDLAGLFDAQPELSCLKPLLPMRTLVAAARRARHVGTGADRVLVADGTVADDVYLHRFSMRSGIRIASLDTLADGEFDLSDDETVQAAQAGMLMMRIDGRRILVVVLRDQRARNLMRLALTQPRETGRIRLVSEQALQRLLLCDSRGIVRNAIDGLRVRYPALSAAPIAPVPRYVAWPRRIVRAAWLTALLAAAITAPALAGHLLALVFLAAIGVRLVASLLEDDRPSRLRVPDADLPIYSVVVALYREERSVAQLLGALTALDYPCEKLDIILAVEADDAATRHAIARANPPAFVRVVAVPDEGPRTKPKALNVALPFARGRYIVVYDAEDRPDPDQLRLALAAFSAGGGNLACVQARLAIENARDSVITRLFAAEYAAQFDIVMPGYERLGLPWPLGGTSNHFDAARLREAAAWDPFNVTEDADLGLRFARLHLRTATIDSTTWEEAPIRWQPWLKQRTRWMKGWMQTWWVHTRHPRRYWRRTGWRGMVARDLLIGGALLAALAYPLLAILGVTMAGEYILTGDVAFMARLVPPLHGFSIAAGLGIAMLLKLRGLARRDRLSHAWVLLLTPLYWAMLSCAAWRAAFQLRSRPYHWEKTEHGVRRDP